jgi:DNA-directed RNA polymerase alpha subunit
MCEWRNVRLVELTGGEEMSERGLVDPTPELPDDILIENVRFAARVRNVLAAAGLKTVGEIRETADETLLSFQDLGKSSVAHIRETLGSPSTEGVRPSDKKPA